MLATRVIATSALLVLLAGCGSDESTKTVTETTTVTNGGDAATSADLPQGDDPVEIDPAEFSADITNRYWPMQPGTRWTYEEVEDDEILQVVVTATSETKQLANGVTARVVRDTVTQGNEVVEDTFDWYAQDADGNVWYMGEDTAEFEDGKLASRDGAWEAGVDGALPGIVMPARPADGMAYRQEYYEGEAEDNGEVLSTGEQAEVPAGHYTDVVVTRDWITLEPKVLEFKFYAPGIGPVLALGISGGSGREELVQVTSVGADVARAAGTTKLGEPYDLDPGHPLRG